MSGHVLTPVFPALAVQRVGGGRAHVLGPVETVGDDLEALTGLLCRVGQVVEQGRSSPRGLLRAFARWPGGSRGVRAIARPGRVVVGGQS